MSRTALPVALPLRTEWNRLVNEHHDVLVIGGGIHGAGAARAAALRGLRTALIERADWASGSSSRSSKLLHGGLRYLRQGSLRLVREALRERERHRRIAPSSVRTVRFRVARPGRGGPPLWQVRAGIALYDLLTGTPGRSRIWDEEPTFEDLAVDDARFCVEVMADARRHGALCLSYVEWLQWVRRGERLVGARVRDRLSGEEGWVSAATFVNAAGPWADLVLGSSRPTGGARLRLTRGTHIVLDRRADEDARIFFAADGRVLFLLPYVDGRSLLGTTDLDDPTPVQDPVATEEEIHYLREALHTQFPEWRHWRPVGLMCGLRPLLAGGGHPSRVSREDRVEAEPVRGLVSMLGGKYTTYRSAAERAISAVEEMIGRPRRRCPTRDATIPPLERGRDRSQQIRRAFVEEDAVRLEDVFLRRTALGHCGRVEIPLLELAAKLWRLRWGMGEEDAEREIQAFRESEGRRLAPLSAWDA